MEAIYRNLVTRTTIKSIMREHCHGIMEKCSMALQALNIDTICPAPEVMTC